MSTVRPKGWLREDLCRRRQHAAARVASDAVQRLLVGAERRLLGLGRDDEASGLGALALGHRDRVGSCSAHDDRRFVPPWPALTKRYSRLNVTWSSNGRDWRGQINELRIEHIVKDEPG
jgi:hypothetical protein